MADIAVSAEKLLELGLTQADIDKLNGSAESRRAESTRKSYFKDWLFYIEYLKGRGVSEKDDEKVFSPLWIAMYLQSQHEKGLAPTTIARRRASIAHKYRQVSGDEGLKNNPAHHPSVASVMEGIERASRAKGWMKTKKRPLFSGMILHWASKLGKSDRELRDLSLICMLFATAMRRSELSRLRWEDIQERKNGGLRILIRNAKGDRKGKGQYITLKSDDHLPTIKSFKKWKKFCEKSGVNTRIGCVFRGINRHGTLSPRGLSGVAIAGVVKLAVEPYIRDFEVFRKDFESDEAYEEALKAAIMEYSGHSSRRGFLTEAAESGKSPFLIKKHGRHASMASLDEYVDLSLDVEDSHHIGYGIT